mgnify:CR=1 FL=1
MTESRGPSGEVASGMVCGRSDRNEFKLSSGNEYRSGELATNGGWSGESGGVEAASTCGDLSIAVFDSEFVAESIRTSDRLPRRMATSLGVRLSLPCTRSTLRTVLGIDPPFNRSTNNRTVSSELVRAAMWKGVSPSLHTTREDDMPFECAIHQIR